MSWYYALKCRPVRVSSQHQEQDSVMKTCKRKRLRRSQKGTESTSSCSEDDFMPRKQKSRVVAQIESSGESSMEDSDCETNSRQGSSNIPLGLKESTFNSLSTLHKSLRDSAMNSEVDNFQNNKTSSGAPLHVISSNGLDRLPQSDILGVQNVTNNQRVPLSDASNSMHSHELQRSNSPIDIKEEVLTCEEANDSTAESELFQSMASFPDPTAESELFQSMVSLPGPSNRRDQPFIRQEAFMKKCLHNQEMIKNILELHTVLLSQILNAKDETAADADNAFDNLPLSTIYDLKVFQRKLKDKNFFKKAVNTLALKEGHSLDVATRRIMKALLHYDLACRFNWKGEGDKRAFVYMAKVKSLIIKSVKNSKDHEKTPNSEIEEHIKKFLEFFSDDEDFTAQSDASTTSDLTENENLAMEHESSSEESISPEHVHRNAADTSDKVNSSYVTNTTKAIDQRALEMQLRKRLSKARCSEMQEKKESNCVNTVEAVAHRETLELMQAEMKQVNPSISKLKDYMNVVRLKRKIDLTTMPLQDHIKQYPALKVSEVLLWEFETLVGVSEKEMIHRWWNCVPAFVEYSQRTKKPISMNCYSLDVETIKVLTALPDILQPGKRTREPIGNILQTFEAGTKLEDTIPKASDPPRLIFIGLPTDENLSVSCYLNKAPFFTTNSIVRALLLLISTYFVLNIQFPKEASPSFMFISTVLLKEKVPKNCTNPSVLRILQQLKL